jgi:hypothetical protein
VGSRLNPSRCPDLTIPVQNNTGWFNWQVYTNASSLPTDPCYVILAGFYGGSGGGPFRSVRFSIGEAKVSSSIPRTEAVPTPTVLDSGLTTAGIATTTTHPPLTPEVLQRSASSQASAPSGAGIPTGAITALAVGLSTVATLVAATVLGVCLRRQARKAAKMNLGRGRNGSRPSTNELADGASASRNHSSSSPALTDRVSFRHLQQRRQYNLCLWSYRLQGNRRAWRIWMSW